MQNRTSPLMVLNPHEGRTAAALFERFFPADENGPGATEIGVLAYVDRALSGAYRDRAEIYRLGLAALDRAARDRYGALFADCDLDQRDALVADLEREALPDFRVPPQGEFFEMLRNHVREGLFSDPAHGGNREKLGWRFLGHPGVWLEHTAEENLAEEPVTKGGEIRSLEDAGFSLGGDLGEPVEIPGYDPQRSAEPPPDPPMSCSSAWALWAPLSPRSWRAPACASSAWRPDLSAPGGTSCPTSSAPPTMPGAIWGLNS